MNFTCEDRVIDLQPHALVVAGWTGRDIDAVQHHIDELALIGIAPPSRVPLYYRVSCTLLLQAERIEVLGESTSGEVEPLLLKANGEHWLGLASDHTDRELEAHSVAASKQACAKPCASRLWRLGDVENHLDQLILNCDILEQGRWVRYQHGTLAGIRPLRELIEGCPLADGSAMLCGTLAAIGGVRPAGSYRMSLQDPIHQRRIEFAYAVDTLPIIE